MKENSQTNINDSFFEGHYKDVWRKLIPPGLSEVECELVEDLAALEKGDAVLDLMCGYGRHTLPLARKGYSVTAIDNLADYIAEIQETAVAENLPIEALTASSLEANFPSQYKAIICMGNSFAFFNKDDALALLKKISNHLTADGMLMINTWMIAEIAIKHFREKEWLKVDGYKYLLDYRFLFHPSRIESEHTIISGAGEIETINGVDYIFTLSELAGLLQQAGLQMQEVYSTPKKRLFKMGDNRAYIVARKAV